MARPSSSTSGSLAGADAMASPRKMLVIDGKMAVNNGRMVTTDAADCCCGGETCPVPLPMPACASWRLPPNNLVLVRIKEKPVIASVLDRVRLIFSATGTATRTVSGYTPQLGDYAAYRIVEIDDPDPWDDTQPHKVNVFPVWYQDVFGCGRVSEWRAQVIIALKDVDGSTAEYVRACLHVKLGFGGLYWYIDQSYACTPEQPTTGQAVCGVQWSGNASLRRYGTSEATMQTDGIVSHRCPLWGTGVPPAGVWEGTWQATMVGGIEASEADVYCPAGVAGTTIFANDGDTCGLQTLNLPPNYRMRVNGTAREQLRNVLVKPTSTEIYTSDTTTVTAAVIEVRQAFRPGQLVTGSSTTTYTRTTTLQGVVNGPNTSVVNNSVQNSVGTLLRHAMQNRGWVVGSSSAFDIQNGVPVQDWDKAPCTGSKTLVRVVTGSPAYTETLIWTWKTTAVDGESNRIEATFSSRFSDVQPNGATIYFAVRDYDLAIDVTVRLEPLDGERLCPDASAVGVPLVLPSEAQARARLAAWMGAV